MGKVWTPEMKALVSAKAKARAEAKKARLAGEEIQRERLTRPAPATQNEIDNPEPVEKVYVQASKEEIKQQLEEANLALRAANEAAIHWASCCEPGSAKDLQVRGERNAASLRVTVLQEELAQAK